MKEMITVEAIPAADKTLAVAIAEQVAVEIIAVRVDVTTEPAEAEITEQVAAEIIAAVAEVLITETVIIEAAGLRRGINPPPSLKRE